MEDRIAQLVRALCKDAGWEDESGAREHAEAIARIGGGDAVAALVGVLEDYAAVDLSDDGGDVSDECWRASRAAAHGLGLLGEVAVPRLVELVTGPHTRARGYAAGALGATRDPRGLPALLELASDEDDRSDALVALGRLGMPEALPVLRAAAWPVEDPGHENERAVAATAIGELRHADSCELLCGMLRDDSWYVRCFVCEALGELADPDARAALDAACSDSDPRVAARARAARARLI